MEVSDYLGGILICDRCKKGTFTLYDGLCKLCNKEIDTMSDPNVQQLREVIQDLEKVAERLEVPPAEKTDPEKVGQLLIDVYNTRLDDIEARLDTIEDYMNKIKVMP